MKLAATMNPKSRLFTLFMFWWYDSYRKCTSVVAAAAITTAETTIDSNKSPEESSYDLAYLCWILIGVNILGMIIFFLFGRPSDPVIATTNTGESGEPVRMTSIVKITPILDAM